MKKILSCGIGISYAKKMKNVTVMNEKESLTIQ